MGRRPSGAEIRTVLPSSIEELERIRAACRSMVKKRAAVSGVASMVPIPGADVLADVGMLMELIPAINERFGLAPEQIGRLDPKTKFLVYRLVTEVGGPLVGKVIKKQLIVAVLKKVGIRMGAKQAAKFVPLAGQAVAALLGAGAMLYIGNSHIDDCFRVAHGALNPESTDA